MFDLSSILLDDIKKMTENIQVTVNEEDEGFVITAKFGGLIPAVRKVFDTKEEAYEFLKQLQRKITLIEAYVDTLKVIVLDSGTAITKAIIKLRKL
jgi:ABC-type enterochelin transport system substrate-binding protein